MTNEPAQGTVTLLGDLEDRAKALLSDGVHAYFAGGAGDEITTSANEKAWTRLALRQRVLVGVPNRNISIELLGRRRPTPMLVAPSAWQRLAHPDGEVGFARGATAAGLIYTLSTFATTMLEKVADAVDDPSQLWMQTQFFQDRDLTYEIAHRAREAGFEAIVLTVDQPVLGRRDRSASKAFERPGSPNAGGRPTLPVADLTWDDVATFARDVGMPVIAKGVLDPADIPLAKQAGLAGVIVSNHGGRQLDTVLPTAAALPAVARAADDGFPVLVDGGLRRGTDVVKAMALGATAALVARPLLWALAIGGESAVRQAAEIFLLELDIALGVIGIDDVADLHPGLVLPGPWSD